MATAIISVSPQTQIIAGITYYAMSGMDSFFASSNPSDLWTNYASAVWNLGDGTTETGMGVHHLWTTSGTKHVTLTITWKNGTTSATAVDVIVKGTPLFPWDKYVRSDGHDGATGDNNTNDPANGAWLTFAKAQDSWASFRGNFDSTTYRVIGGTLRAFDEVWGRLQVQAGYSVASTSYSTFEFGPVLIKSTADLGGTRWMLALDNTVIDGRGCTIGWYGHDDEISNPTNVWNNSVIMWDVNFDFEGGTDPRTQNPMVPGGRYNAIAIAHHCCQLVNSNVTNAGLQSAKPCPMFIGVAQTHCFKDGYGGGNLFQVMVNTSCIDDGEDATFDNAYYIQSPDYGLFRHCTGRRIANPTEMGGFNMSGMHKSYCADVWIDGCKELLNFGTNGGSTYHVNDNIYERFLGTAIEGACLYSNSCRRVSIRNAVAFGSGIGNSSALGLQPDNGMADQGCDGVEVLCSSFSGVLVGISVNHGFSGFIANISFKDCAVLTPSNGTPIDIASGDVANIISDGNQWLKTGDSATSTTFARVSGSLESFTTWKTRGEDTNSQYGDPLFKNNASDLRLQANSPCITKGLVLESVPYDFTGYRRDLDDLFDIGAYEYVALVFPVSAPPQGDDSRFSQIDAILWATLKDATITTQGKNLDAWRKEQSPSGTYRGRDFDAKEVPGLAEIRDTDFPALVVVTPGVIGQLDVGADYMTVAYAKQIVGIVTSRFDEVLADKKVKKFAELTWALLAFARSIDFGGGALGLFLRATRFKSLLFPVLTQKGVAAFTLDVIFEVDLVVR